jgi:predicted GNAT superfamily acetyltransferase
VTEARAAVSELRELDDLRALRDLFATIWERPDEPPLTLETLRALAHSGSYIAGAHAGDRLVGGLIGWLGGAPSHGLHLHSHILGVAGDRQVRGLGFELKQHQRRWCLERGIGVIEWTTDPLVRRNAYFNLGKLGAQASEYLVNFYGAMSDGLNAGEESDRLLISWQLNSERAAAAAAGRAAEPDIESLLRDGAGVALSVGPSGEPVSGTSTARVLICEVPEDIVALRHAEPSAARFWRLAVRRALGDAFDAGYRITTATRSGHYVLESRVQ